MTFARRIQRRLIGWTRISLIVLLIIVIPFLLFEERIDLLTTAFMRSDPAWWLVAGVFSALLAADILLPVPSSVISTASGVMLGFWGGLAASWLGMTAGCMCGYGVGLFAGQPLIRRKQAIRGAACIYRKNAPKLKRVNP